VSLETGVCLSAELQDFSRFKEAEKSISGEARDFNIEMRAVIKFFSCKARRRRKCSPF
jgi:hypothetical protein